jgi:hypothetical protein
VFRRCHFHTRSVDGCGRARKGAVALSEFQQEIETRMQTARQSLEQARVEGDDYLIQIRLGEIESLERLAAEHQDETLAS